MKLHQAAQQKYKTDIKHKVTRQVQIVKPDATGEEVDAVMRSEGGSDQLYKDRILAGGVNDQIKTPPLAFLDTSSHWCRELLFRRLSSILAGLGRRGPRCRRARKEDGRDRLRGFPQGPSGRFALAGDHFL
jgi:hypothetical protein